MITNLASVLMNFKTCFYFNFYLKPDQPLHHLHYD